MSTLLTPQYFNMNDIVEATSNVFPNPTSSANNTLIGHLDKASRTARSWCIYKAGTLPETKKFDNIDDDIEIKSCFSVWG